MSKCTRHSAARHLFGLTLLLVCSGISTQVWAQLLGGQRAYAWLEQAPTAQSTALAGWQLRSDSRDPALALFNPALLQAPGLRVVSLQHSFLPGGGSQSTLMYGQRLQKAGIDLAGHVEYLGYGSFEGRDLRGDLTQDFTVAEYAVGATAAYHLDERLHVGATLRVLSGTIDGRSSFGLGLSAGAIYVPDSARLTTWGLQFEHFGSQIAGYAAQRDPLPFEVSVGVTRRLAYVPLRVGVRYRHLERWNLLFEDPSAMDGGGILGGEQGPRSDLARWTDNFARHFSVHGEFSIGRKEVVQLRIGYDRLRQQEGRLAQFRSLAGFSYGFGINLRRLRIDYGHARQHLGGGQHRLGLLVDLEPARSDGR